MGLLSNLIGGSSDKANKSGTEKKEVDTSPTSVKDNAPTPAPVAAPAAPPVPQQKEEEKHPETLVFPYLRNPEKYEELVKETERILSTQLEAFDGFKFEFNKSFGPHFSMTHMIGMGSSTEPPAWTTGVNYSYNKTTIFSRFDTELALQAKIIQDIKKDTVSAFAGFTMSPEPDSTSYHIGTDFQGNSWNGQLKFVNPGRTMVWNYSQALLPGLQVGYELAHCAKMSQSAFTTFIRYIKGDAIYNGILSSNVMGAAYTRQITEKVGLSTKVMLMMNPSTNTWESVCFAGYDFRFIHGCVKGNINTQGHVGVFIEDYISNNTKLNISAELDHTKKEYKFGIGATMQF